MRAFKDAGNKTTTTGCRLSAFAQIVFRSKPNQARTTLEICELHSIEKIKEVIHGRPSRRERLLTLARRRRYYDILDDLAWNILVRIEGFLLKHTVGNFNAAIHHDNYEQLDLSEIAREQPIVKPIGSPSGLVYRFFHKNIEEIRSKKLDLLIRADRGYFEATYECVSVWNHLISPW